MSFTTSLKTVEPLGTMVARYGTPEDLVSDNGPQLAAEEVTKFMRQNGVKFTHVPPYHPATNGAEKCSVLMAKVALTKWVLDGTANTLSLEHWLADFLILNRSTPSLSLSQDNSQLTFFEKSNKKLVHTTEAESEQSNGRKTGETERVPWWRARQVS